MVAYVILSDTIMMKIELEDYSFRDNGIIFLKDKQGDVYLTHISNVIIVTKN